MESLRTITVPHEIIVVLHLCTDRSRKIVDEFIATLETGSSLVRVFEHDVQISRPGYENLVTPMSHPASAITYNNTVFGKARYKWICKWDADFRTTDTFTKFINTELDIYTNAPTMYTLTCTLDGDVHNREWYLYNALSCFIKFMFWETTRMVPGSQSFDRTDVIIRSLSYNVVKDYWREKPWFIGVDAELEEKYNYLTSLVGEEPIGIARASYPPSIDKQYLCDHFRPQLNEKGIDFFI